MTDGRGRDADRDVDDDDATDERAAEAVPSAHRVDVDPSLPRTDDAATTRGSDADPDATTGAVDRRGGQLAGAHPAAVDRQFDWRGWTLVAAIVVSFLVIPGVIALYPHVGPRLGLTFWDTYLALPLIPAVVLAVLAVWATTRP